MRNGRQRVIYDLSQYNMAAFGGKHCNLTNSSGRTDLVDEAKSTDYAELAAVYADFNGCEGLGEGEAGLMKNPEYGHIGADTAL